MPSIKLINQGTYGCVYHPGIKCNGNPMTSEKFITKIQRNDETVQNEIRIGKIVKTIPQFSRFFAPIISSCPAKITKKVAEGCTVIENGATSFVSTKIRYVGKQTLGAYITESNIRERYVRSKKHLVRALEKLNEHGIVHFDVKQNNVMYDARLKVPVFIDFGLSIYVKDILGTAGRDNLRNTFYTFNTYDYWPVEVCMFGFAFTELGVEEASQRRITSSDIDRVLDVFVNGKMDRDGNKSPNNLFGSKYSGVSADSFMRSAQSYFGRYVGKTWTQMYDEMMEAGVWKRWDKYGLDATYIFLAEDANDQNIADLVPKIQMLP